MPQILCLWDPTGCQRPHGYRSPPVRSFSKGSPSSPQHPSYLHNLHKTYIVRIFTKEHTPSIWGLLPKCWLLCYLLLLTTQWPSLFCYASVKDQVVPKAASSLKRREPLTRKPGRAIISSEPTYSTRDISTSTFVFARRPSYSAAGPFGPRDAKKTKGVGWGTLKGSPVQQQTLQLITANLPTGSTSTSSAEAAHCVFHLQVLNHWKKK